MKSVEITTREEEKEKKSVFVIKSVLARQQRVVGFGSSKPGGRKPNAYGQKMRTYAMGPATLFFRLAPRPIVICGTQRTRTQHAVSHLTEIVQGEKKDN